MSDERNWTGERLLLQLGAISAVVGTVLQIAAGTGSSSVPAGDVAATLSGLAGQPGWLWPTFYLGFVFGALLWAGALVALAADLTEGPAWALGRLAAAAVLVGATVHATDGAMNGVGLASLGRAWAAPGADQAVLAQQAELLRGILDGTWAAVTTLFHGVPFALAGLAVAASRRYPAWLGWVGIVGGLGSVVVGLALFLDAAPAGLAVPLALVDSLFMVVLGWLMWGRAGAGVDESTPPAGSRG